MSNEELNEPVTTPSVALVPAHPIDPARDVTGKFVPGGVTDARKRGLDKVTKIMKSELAAELEAAGVNGNPLVILARIARDEGQNAMVRVQACDKLARYLAPRLLSIELEEPDATFEAETVRIRASLRSLFVDGAK